MQTIFSFRRQLGKTITLTILFTFLFPSQASACAFNPVCWLGGLGLAKEVIDPFNVDVNTSIENVDELKQLIDLTSQRLEILSKEAAKTTSTELQKAVKQTIIQLKDYTRFVDKKVGQRIADLDASIQVKLLWIERYTKQVNAHAEDIIKQLSRETQIIIKSAEDAGNSLLKEGGRQTLSIVNASEKAVQSIVDVAEASGLSLLKEAEDSSRLIIKDSEKTVLSIVSAAGTQGKYLINAFGEEGRSIVNTAGIESRLTIRTASEEAQKITGAISHETQQIIMTANSELQDTIYLTEDGIKKSINDAQKGVLRVLNGTLFTINRTAEIALSVVGVGTGIIFLFISFFGWGRSFLIYKLSPGHPNRKIILFLMKGTFVAAFFPFILLVPRVRAQILFSVAQARPYSDGSSTKSLQVKPEIWRVNPERVIIKDEDTKKTSLLVIQGKNFLAYSDPIAKFGDIELSLIGKQEDKLTFDLSPVYQHPKKAKSIDIKLNPSSNESNLITVIDFSSNADRCTSLNDLSHSNQKPVTNNKIDKLPPPPPLLRTTKTTDTTKETYIDGSKYEGQIHNCLRHGRGTYIRADGDQYQGDWFKDKYHGEGKYIWANGDQYQGEWHNGLRHGEGIWKGFDGTIVKGIWNNNELVHRIP